MSGAGITALTLAVAAAAFVAAAVLFSNLGVRQWPEDALLIDIHSLAPTPSAPTPVPPPTPVAGAQWRGIAILTAALDTSDGTASGTANPNPLTVNADGRVEGYGWIVPDAFFHPGDRVAITGRMFTIPGCIDNSNRLHRYFYAAPSSTGPLQSLTIGAGLNQVQTWPLAVPPGGGFEVDIGGTATPYDIHVGVWRLDCSPTPAGAGGRILEVYP